MPTSRRSLAAHDRLTALASGPVPGPRPAAGTGWLPAAPPGSADVVDAPARRVVLPFTRAAPLGNGEDHDPSTSGDRAGARPGRGRHRAGDPGRAGAGTPHTGAGDAADGDPGAGPAPRAAPGPEPGAAQGPAAARSLGAALVPGTLRGARWRVAPRAAGGALLALAVLAAALAVRAGAPDDGVTVVPARPAPATTTPAAAADLARTGSAAAVGAPVQAAPAPGVQATPAAGAGPTLVVHVVGQVATPGLVTVADGSRVADALAAAGGATAGADLSRLNLARPVVDGEQLVVPLPGEVVAAAPAGAAPPPSGAAAGGTGPGTGPVDLNRADLAALDALPGIGPVLAQRILDWRAEHGRFTSVEELGEVTGIGDTLLGRLRDAVTV